MVEINNLKHDIEALSAERDAFRKEVENGINYKSL